MKKKDFNYEFGEKIEWGHHEDESFETGYFIAELPIEHKYLVCLYESELEYISEGNLAMMNYPSVFQVKEIRPFRKKFTLEEARKALSFEHDIAVKFIEIEKE